MIQIIAALYYRWLEDPKQTFGQLLFSLFGIRDLLTTPNELVASKLLERK